MADRFADINIIPEGGPTTPTGFKAAGIHAGFRRDPNRLDMALVVSDDPCPCACMFTQNAFAAAPVLFDREQLERSSGCPSYGTMRSVLVNSGLANAATGAEGFERAEASARLAAQTLGCPESEVLVASTGVIGVQLKMEPFETGLPLAVEALSQEGGMDAAHAIMTTDTVAKHCAVRVSYNAGPLAGRSFSIGGMTKGSGMIMPNMATMIAVLTTDAPLLAPDLHRALERAVAVSFNRITVDSDTSTNDSCFLFANPVHGALGAPDFRIAPDTPEFHAFEEALTHLCIHLAKSMAKDGEGATRLVEVTVRGAVSVADADRAAREVANSPLVKTAIAGRDANWGRIAAALGKSGAAFNQGDVDISILGLEVCKAGLALDFSEEEALRRFEDDEILIEVDLHAGSATATLWTCDLTHDYISINGDYRS